MRAPKSAAVIGEYDPAAVDASPTEGSGHHWDTEMYIRRKIGSIAEVAKVARTRNFANWPTAQAAMYMVADEVEMTAAGMSSGADENADNAGTVAGS